MADSVEGWDCRNRTEEYFSFPPWVSWSLQLTAMHLLHCDTLPTRDRTPVTRRSSHVGVSFLINACSVPPTLTSTGSTAGVGAECGPRRSCNHTKGGLTGGVGE
ncbi:hypothetical protein B296_00051270 [Ensete ventricosum]|uniref:Uncharacterized protein n=1 Tax=Ensete ventricosum TaxID=4639 RepID=A0A426XX42_ENSVE|nr:hypothetical protein B296_00051270 [Ensete ventricosum]